MGQMIYNVNDAATQVLAAKQVKENIFVDLVHKNGYGVNQVEETNASTVRIMKVKPFTDSARELGAGTNGKWFNNGTIGTPEVDEYDLNLLNVYDMPVDIPEVEQDMVSVNLMDAATKNIGGRVATEINASTLAAQLAAAYNAADTENAWTGHASVIGTGENATYAAVQAASTLLDDGDEENGIQAFPFAERQLIMRPSFRAELLNSKGVLLGGSNYAQSMLAKGAVSPEARKEWGNMYCGEIDGIPCYISPAQIWKRAGEWVGSATAFADAEAAWNTTFGTSTETN